jgi:hypothetical protein
LVLIAMKNILFFTALAVLGLAWMGEKFSADRMAAELTRLRQQHDEISRLLHERDRLFQRRNDAEKLEIAQLEEAAPATPSIAARQEAKLRVAMPLGDWVGMQGWGFRGQATPQASIESALWAAAGGDVATLKQLLFVSDEARTAAAALWASLPASSRTAYQGPDDLISALTIKRIPLGEAQLVWLNQNGPDNATACVFIKDPLNPIGAYDPAPVSQAEGSRPPQLAPDEKSVAAYLALQREGDRWRLVVPPAAIGALARELITMTKPGS